MIRFLLDENFNGKIARGLRARKPGGFSAFVAGVAIVTDINAGRGAEQLRLEGVAEVRPFGVYGSLAEALMGEVRG